MSDEVGSSLSFSSIMNELQLAGEFCDAVMRVEDVEFPVHKIILCDCSPYFGALLRRWATRDKRVFDISGLSPHIMQLITEFAYTGSVSVTEENAQELLIAADHLNVMEIVRSCCSFLGERLCQENCISILQLTKVYYTPDLQRKAYRFIRDHFADVRNLDMENETFFS